MRADLVYLQTESGVSSLAALNYRNSKQTTQHKPTAEVKGGIVLYICLVYPHVIPEEMFKNILSTLYLWTIDVAFEKEMYIFIPRQQRWIYKQSASVRLFVHPSVIPSVRPSNRKERPLTATIFHRSLPNFYTMFILLKKFIICSFIKNCLKLLPWQPFFFFTFQAYLPMFLPYMKA